MARITFARFANALGRLFGIDADAASAKAGDLAEYSEQDRNAIRSTRPDIRRAQSDASTRGGGSRDID